MKYRLFLITVLASVAFYNPHAVVSEQMQKLIFYICVLASLAVAVFDGAPQLRAAKYPRKAYVVLLVSIAFSAVMSTAFHMQRLSVSVVATMPYIFAYLFFFALIGLNVPERKIMNTYLVLCGISAVVYFANVLTFPNNIFGEPILNEDMSRGIVRIPVVFIEFFPMMVFYAINKFMLGRDKRWLWVIALGMLMIVLSVIRQIILLTAMLGLFFYFRNVNWKTKVAIGAAVVGFVLVVLPMIPMYQAMVELSEQQKEENEDEENIRITAWRYYTHENQTNALTAVFGNGIPSFGNSRWGTEFDSEVQENGCLFVDVGWAGFYWLYGIFALGALIVLELNALLKKKDNEHQYLNYWLVFLGITSFASGPPVIFWQIVDIAVCLYLVFCCCQQPKPEEEAEASAELAVGDAEPELLPGLPQLPAEPRYPQF